MSGEALLEALMTPALEGSTTQEAVLLDRYCRRLRALDRDAGNEFMSENREQILGRLPGARAKAVFVLGGWLAADPSAWESWAALLDLDGLSDGEVDALGLAVGVAVFEQAGGDVEAEQIDAFGQLIETLRPTLGKVGAEEEIKRLREAGQEALVNDWIEDESVLNRQCARHRLIRGLERVAPEAGEVLQGVRSADVLWPVEQEKVIGELILRGWREMAVEVSEEAYGAIFRAIPDPDRETEPERFAEAVATRATIRREGPFAGGPPIVKGHLSELGVLRKMGESYRGQRRVAALACIDLGPRSSQLTWLLWHAGRRPGSEARESVKRWTEDAGRARTSTLIKEVMPFYVASDWMAVFAECSYDETPVLKAVDKVLFKDENQVDVRKKMAASLEMLGLRTKGGPDKVAKMIVDLLNPRRKKHHKVNLAVALTLCRTVGTDHEKSSSIEKQLIAYAKKWDHKFSEEQNKSILSAGVRLPEKYLNKKARKGLTGVLEEMASVAEGVANKAGDVVSGVTERLR